MKHHKNKPTFRFIHEPKEFNKYSEREFLQYCLGATMYMPGTKDIAENILSKRWPELTSMVMCFEDAIAEHELAQAEDNVIGTLNRIFAAIQEGEFSTQDLPLIILRVRDFEQFRRFSERLTREHVSLLAAFNFPKFTSKKCCKLLGAP